MKPPSPLSQIDPHLVNQIIALPRKPEVMNFAFFPTEADYHILMPSCRHVDHARYVRQMAAAVAAAQSRGIPTIVREYRAGPYSAWLRFHAFEDNPRHRKIYLMLAPFVRDGAMVARLGLPSAFPPGAHQPKLDATEVPLTRADVVWSEEQLVVLAKEHPDWDTIILLRMILALSLIAGDAVPAAALRQLANRISTGYPQRLVNLIEFESLDLAAALRGDGSGRN